MSKIIWGILGAGDVAETKSGPAFKKIARSELRAVMRRNGKKAADFAKRHQVPLWYDNAEELLSNPDINAIYIATPPDSHLEYTRRALAAGKDIYLEKPMVLNATEGEELVALSQKFKSKITVAHYRRQLPAFLKVKELLKGKAIGDIRLVDITILQPAVNDIITHTEVNWRTDPTVSGGGYFHDIGPHQLDLMYHYFGDYSSAAGFSINQQKKYQADDLVTGLIHFKNGIQFRGVWGFNTAPDDQIDRCTIYGSEGHLSFSFYGTKVMVVRAGDSQRFVFENPAYIQQPMIAATVDYFLDKGWNPCSVEEGLKVIRLMDSFTNTSV